MRELDYLLSCLKAEAPDQIRPLAGRLGIPYGTLRKLRSGSTSNPRYSTVERLRAYYLSAAQRANPVLQALQQPADYNGPERRKQAA